MNNGLVNTKIRLTFRSISRETPYNYGSAAKLKCMRQGIVLQAHAESISSTSQYTNCVFIQIASKHLNGKLAHFY